MRRALRVTTVAFGLAATMLLVGTGVANAATYSFACEPPQFVGSGPECGEHAGSQRQRKSSARLWGQPWPLFEIGPVTADVAVAGLLALFVAALTVLAGVIARAGRQLATLLVPAAFLVIAGVVARGPLEVLSPAGRVSPESPGELVADAIYWLVLGAVALVAAVALARPTPGRTDA